LTLSTNENSAHKTEANPDKKDTTASLDPISHPTPLDPPQEVVPQAFQVASQAQEVAAKACEPEPPPSLVSDCGDSGISASNDSQYYAKMTIIDDMDSLNNSISEEPEEEEEELEGGRAKYTRSISEPPREASLSLAATPVRKLSECEPRSNQLTGLFFQRLLASDEGEGGQYRSSSSLASQESKDSGRSEGSGLRKFESRASLNTTGTNESPAMASKFGSSFTVNKHKKVDLDSFDQQPVPKRREARFSQGEERSTSEGGFEIGPMKKAASLAHVDTSPRGKTRPDPSLMQDKFDGRTLLHLFASCFTEDSYLRVQLTSQVSSTICFHQHSHFTGFPIPWTPALLSSPWSWRPPSCTGPR
jgi:hypothetical protein